MKNSHKLMTTVLVVLLSLGQSLATSPYEKAMKKAMEKLSQSSSVETFNESGNMFDRIAMQSEAHWQPAYYSAYTRIIMAAITEDLNDKDAYLDVAQKHLDNLETIAGHDVDERLALQGFAHMIRITVDPATRGQEFSGKSAAVLNQAVALDATNPRALYMLAQMNYGTAQFFGSDTSEACGMFKKAVELYNEVEKSEQEFAPNWGMEQASGMLQQCGG